jgi:hypothetical protein
MKSIRKSIRKIPARTSNVLRATVMTSHEFREHLGRLDLTQAAFAQLVGVDVRTVKRWASPIDPCEIPRTVEILLPLLSLTKVKALLAVA